MGIFNFRNKKAVEQRELEYVSPCADALKFGNIYNKYSSMNLSAVYAATEMISSNIAMMPCRYMSYKDKHDSSVKTHPLNLIFNDKADNTINFYNMMKLIVQSVILKGNSFVYIERAMDGTPIKLRWLPSNNVTIDYNKDKDTLYYYSSLVSSKRISPNDMLHFKLNSWDGVNGLSIISFATRTIELANGAENAAKEFYSNGCALSGILKVNSQLTAKQKEDIRMSWNQAYGNGAGGIGILQGNMEYQPISINSADAQLLETRQFNITDIARFFNISPILLGDLTHNAYGTVEALQNIFINHTLMPYVRMIESELNKKLVSDDEFYIDLDENALRLQDKTAQAAYYSSMLQNGVYCIDDVRIELGLKPIGLTKHIIPYTDINQNTINSNNMENKEGN